MEKPANAPGCFAAASVFSHDSNICRGCCVFDRCSAASLETLEKIQNVVSVQDLLKRHQRARKVAQEAIRENDERLAAARPPGNVDQPLMSKVERKTEPVRAKVRVSQDELDVIALLPVKSKQVAVGLIRSGNLERLKQTVTEGRNPFDESGPKFLRIAMMLLLSGGFTRAELRERLCVDLGWTNVSAASHVSMTCPVFVNFGIAQEVDGRFVLAPGLSA